MLVKLIHEINVDDCDRRQEFCERINYQPNFLYNSFHIQPGGAPPHYAAPVRQYLNLEYLGRWIGRSGPMEWPARSPDVNPLDFFLRGHLKSKIFLTHPKNLDELRQQLTPIMLNYVKNGFQARLYYCMEVNEDNMTIRFKHSDLIF